MKVLFVCSGNHKNVVPFITDQKDHLEHEGIRVDLFLIKGKGVLGYLKNIPRYYNLLKNSSYDLVHAHFGLSGLFASFQFGLPVIITLHGTDVNKRKNRFFSRLAALFAQKVIFVSKRMSLKMKARNYSVLPCGVDTKIFKPMDREQSRKELFHTCNISFNSDVKYVLFSASFDREVKNPALAKEAVEHLGEDYVLLELKNFTRDEVALLLNSVDVALLTSRSEGSPQFIKEAMACNCPIVSTNVGDVKEIIDDTEGCLICNNDPKEISNAILNAISVGKTSGRQRIISGYERNHITKSLIDEYEMLLGKRTD
ncbi:MAG: glycosyltransferase [Cytophagales bacterium]|nr:glycosyltransferase [Cytophagales bacterium]